MTFVETNSADAIGPTNAEEMTEQNLANTTINEAASSGDVEQALDTCGSEPAVDTGDIEQAADYGNIEPAIDTGDIDEAVKNIVHELAVESVMIAQEPDRAVNLGIRRPLGRFRLRIRSYLNPSLSHSGSPPWRRPETLMRQQHACAPRRELLLRRCMMT